MAGNDVREIGSHEVNAAQPYVRIIKRPITFPSHADPNVLIHGTIWYPARSAADDGLGNVRGVVQIVHGMAEYLGRYDACARFLVRNGYLVCGHDQFGHGSSVSSPDKLGCLPAHGGAQALVDDAHEMYARTQDFLTQNGLDLATDIRGEKAGSTADDGGSQPSSNHSSGSSSSGSLPYFLFGHSMGSFVARAYVAEHGGDLAGAIICGTGFIPVATSRAGNLLARAICRLRGEDAHSELLHSLADGAYAKKIVDAKTPFDWLSYDVDNVNAYIADDLCGYQFSAGGYATLTELTARVCSPACARQVPPELPLLYISGADDPVGDFGKGVEAAADLAKKAGSRHVDVKLLEGMRHEILNETDSGRAMREILGWLDANCAPGARTR